MSNGDISLAAQCALHLLHLSVTLDKYMCSFPGLRDTLQIILYMLKATREQQSLQYLMPIVEETVRLAGLDQRRIHDWQDCLLMILLH